MAVALVARSHESRTGRRETRSALLQGISIVGAVACGEGLESPSSCRARPTDGDGGAASLSDGHDAMGARRKRRIWRSCVPIEHARHHGSTRKEKEMKPPKKSLVGGETVTEWPRRAGSGLASLERPNQVFDLSQALNVRLAKLGLASGAEQVTKQAKFTLCA
jgi:hypothetical protein